LREKIDCKWLLTLESALVYRIAIRQPLSGNISIMQKSGSTKTINAGAGSDDRGRPASEQKARASGWLPKAAARLAAAVAGVVKHRKNKAALNSASGANRLERFGEMLSHLRSLVINSFFFLAAIALAVIIVRQLTNNPVVVEPVSVPDALAKQGYTPKIIGQRIVDDIYKIQRAATTVKERRDLMPEWAQLDVEMPGAGMSVKEIGRIIKESLGIPTSRISGEVVMVNQHFRLRLRFGGGRQTAETPPLAAEKLGDMIHLGAQQSVKAIDPFLLASYFYATKDQDAMLEMIRYCLANDPAQDDPWALNLWGIHYADRKQWPDAIKKYRAAVKIDPQFALAYQNWGNAYEKQGEYKMAVEKYRQSTDLDPDLTLAYQNWGIALSKWAIALSQQRRYQEAIEKFKAAVAKNPGHAPAYTYWGRVYYQQDKSKAAIAKYKKALAIEPDNAQIYFYLGNAYQKLDDNSAAIENYRIALDLKPDRYNFLKSRIEKLQANPTGG
jgi:tetratricopeptide (TPR) repeat protein